MCEGEMAHHASRKVYSLHAPEVECIGKGKAHRRYEFGVGLDRHHASSFRRAGNCPRQDADPYDGHTLATVIPEIKVRLVTRFGSPLQRVEAAFPARYARRPPC